MKKAEREGNRCSEVFAHTQDRILLVWEKQGRSRWSLRMRRNHSNSGNYRNPCLTMHQPWASLLVYGIKRVEGRSWPSPIKGFSFFLRFNLYVSNNHIPCPMSYVWCSLFLLLVKVVFGFMPPVKFRMSLLSKQWNISTGRFMRSMASLISNFLNTTPFLGFWVWITV